MTLLHKESSPCPSGVLKSLALAPAHSEDAFGIQAAQDFTVGKDFNTSLGVRVDSLIKCQISIMQHNYAI